MSAHKDILKSPTSEVFLKQIDDSVIEFELRFFINIRQVKSRISVISSVLIIIWDVFAEHGIRPSYPKREVFLQSPLSIPDNEG
jgi:potassium efflux system protein